MPDSELGPESQWGGILFVVAVAAIVLWLLWQGGVLRRDGFTNAPPRNGRMGLADLFLGLGLWILLPLTALVMLELWRRGSGEAEGAALEAREMLVQMAVAEAAMVPVVLLILWRAHRVVEGGIGAFGLSLRSPGRTARGLILGFLAVMPVTLAVAAVARALVQWLGGVELEQIGHGALQEVAKAPWEPAAWGIIALAVVGAPLVEEIIFRGLVQTSLHQSGAIRGRWGVIALAAGLFALVHGGVIPEGQSQLQLAVVMPTLFILGLGLGVAYEWTGSLWAPIGIHALFNASQVGMVLALREAGAL